MRICIDIDGVLAEGDSWPYYATCLQVKGAAASIQELLAAGHYIVLHTSRFEEDRAVTRKWLRDHQILYDQLIMDKPFADVYIDDKGLKFEDWDDTMQALLGLSQGGKCVQTDTIE